MRYNLQLHIIFLTKPMKKVLIIILLAFSIATNGQNQSIGIQDGLSITNVTANTDHKLGLISGIKYEILLSDKYALSTDLLYSQQGFKDDIFYSDALGTIIGSDKAKYKYDYILLPFKFGISFGNKFRVTPKVGICPALLINAKIEIPAFEQNGTSIPKETYDIKDNTNKFDLSGLVEAEFLYRLNNEIDIFTSALYRQSFTEFSNNIFFSGEHMRHYGFSFSFGLKFKVK